MDDTSNVPKGFISAIVHKFLTSHLSIIFILISLMAGIGAILITPKEEDPQIIVPLADIYVSVPGSSAKEVEKLVATPLERLLWQIDGVEYVYSMSRKDMAVVTVRFFVGEDRENSLVKIHNKITMNIDEVPPIVKNWVIKPIEIDDVPILTVALYSSQYDSHDLRRIGEEVLSRLSEVKDTSRTHIVGGQQREVRVELHPEKMQGLGISLIEVEQALKGSDVAITAGDFNRFNKNFKVTSDAFLSSTDDLAVLMVGVYDDRPVYLRDISTIIDGPEEATTYSRIGFSDAFRRKEKVQDIVDTYPSVTLAIAKKKGTNAVSVAQDVLKKLESLKGDVIPDDVEMNITRNYGETSQQKVNELLSSLFFAIVTVIILLAVTLGWREALVVAIAVPISFSLALMVNYLSGYTINRVTLFALILSLGLVVDDPITNVDNIQRHIFNGDRKPLSATMFAVNEVLPPVIMSTIAIILSFAPLFFITGMMGPYMAPMAINVPITVTFSTVCALTFVPWMTYLLLKNKTTISRKAQKDSINETGRSWIYKSYRWIMEPFLNSKKHRFFLAVGIIGLLIIPILLVILRMVPLKMLPFDNKNEFQIVIDMPEGTTLETTDGVVQKFEELIRTVPEVTSFVSFVGTSSPIDFNGLVRHYYLRTGASSADIRVNFLKKDKRKESSHGIVLRLRNELTRIGKESGADIKIVEVPPGPPVLSTIVAEVTGLPNKSYESLVKGADHVKKIMGSEPFVVDIDDSTESEHLRVDFILDKEKAALHGVSSMDITQTVNIALSGHTPAMLHKTDERNPLLIRLILPREKRSSIVSLNQIPIKTKSGGMVQLGEIAKAVKINSDQPIHHKNLERVVYVMAEMAGRAPGEAILDMQKRLKDSPLEKGISVNWAGEGEWKITLRVFRDMGIAFVVALAGIYILLIVQTNSFFMPLLIMMAIPLTLIGAMPGFFFLNLFFTNPVGGFANPTFFTATGMIGMIALGGIVIRNSIVLIEFIEESIKQNVPLKEAIFKSGAIRMRPILLTAGTTLLGSWPITLDPIFSGLAWTLIFGLFASTLFTLVVIPVTYYVIYQKKDV